MKTENNGVGYFKDFVWKEIGDLEWNKPNPNAPVFIDIFGRSLVLCQVMPSENGMTKLIEIEIL